MNRRDLLPGALAAAVLVATPSNRAAAQTCVAPCYERTPREISENIVPEDYQYPPGNVLRYGADPTGKVSATSAINTAILATPAGGGIVDFPVGYYRCEGPILCDQRLAITLRGRGGVTAAQESTKLNFTPASNGASFISMHAAQGCTIEDLQIHASDTFTGYLIDFSRRPDESEAVLNEVRRCLIGNPYTSNTLCYGINLDKATNFTARGNKFEYLKAAIHGQSGAGHSYSNCVRILENVFIGIEDHAIAYGGEAWQIRGNTFEQRKSGVAGAFGCLEGTPCHGLSFEDNWFGDVETDGGQWVIVFGGGFVFKGNRCGGSAGSHAISLHAVDGADISGNSFDTFAVVVSFDGATCRNISVGENEYASVTNVYGSPNNQSSFRRSPVGFASLPNGLLMQWGQLPISGGANIAVTFPRSFGAVYSVVASLVGPTAPTNVAYANNVTTTGMTAGMSGSGAGTLHWIATGNQ